MCFQSQIKNALEHLKTMKNLVKRTPYICHLNKKMLFTTVWLTENKFQQLILNHFYTVDAWCLL